MDDNLQHEALLRIKVAERLHGNAEDIAFADDGCLARQTATIWCLLGSPRIGDYVHFILISLCKTK